MLEYSLLSSDDSAIYINFPFCKIPCTYCHYVDNILFGYNEIPKNYFEMLIQQLDSILRKMKKKNFDSIYFGGGTPSLLSDTQCNEIRDLLKKYSIKSDEISMEIHPGMCNFDYINNDFFTRYSIGVQSFDENIKKDYHRMSYKIQDVIDLVNNIKKGNFKRVINIDLVFDTKLKGVDLEYINLLQPDTVTFYPNTKGRGKNRLISVLDTLDWVKTNIQGYFTLGKSKYIFIKNGCEQSKYSKLEYEKNGNIIGVGHNSVSYIGNTSYICRYEEDNIRIKERIQKEDRILSSIMMAISSGVPMGTILKYYPELCQQHFLLTVDSDIDIMDKHISLEESELVYLPDDEYIRFYSYLVESKKENFADIFLKSVGFGDSDRDVIEYAYNNVMRLESNRMRDLISILGEDLKKIETPNMNILIEGIDGSGKDTFARYFSRELKKRFLFNSKSQISITGEPNSKLKCGIEAKKFIEDLDYDGNSEDVKEILTQNRIASEERLKAISGIKILIRGLVTDKATFYRVFGKNENLGEKEQIRKWDLYIVVDVSPKIADERIGRRKVPRTWRESLEHLEFFREFYLNYNDKFFADKIIIENNDIQSLKKKAIELADRIYINASGEGK